MSCRLSPSYRLSNSSARYSIDCTSMLCQGLYSSRTRLAFYMFLNNPNTYIQGVLKDILKISFAKTSYSSLLDMRVVWVKIQNANRSLKVAVLSPFTTKVEEKVLLKNFHTDIFFSTTLKCFTSLIFELCYQNCVSILFIIIVFLMDESLLQY